MHPVNTLDNRMQLSPCNLGDCHVSTVQYHGQNGSPTQLRAGIKVTGISPFDSDKVTTNNTPREDIGRQL